MATKSSKIAVTLEPSLKQQLRDYGKENQIKNFSGVILSILDEYFSGDKTPASEPEVAATDSDVLGVIKELTARIEKLESDADDTATTDESESKPEETVEKPVLKPKTRATRRTSSRSSATSSKVAAKPGRKPTTRKSVSAKTAKAPSTATKPTKKVSTRVTKSTKASTKATSTKASTKASNKVAPVKKGKTTRRTSTARKPSVKSSSVDQWMSTREAFNIYGGTLSWSRFSKLTPEELKERFNLDSDLSRKVRGSRFNQWLKPGK